MIKIGQKYRETRNCLGEPVKANLTILDGPRVVEKQREWYCKRDYIRKYVSQATGEIITEKARDFYWLGEDFLELKLKRKEMLLNEKR